MNPAQLLFRGDAVSSIVACVLLTMSVCTWVVIVWKSWWLVRALGDVERSSSAFWQAPDWEQAMQTVAALDRQQVLTPLVVASQLPLQDTLGAQGDRSQQLTRLLRDALHTVLRQLQAGQVLLATVGATAPFVGLLGTVWGIYHALIGIAASGQASIDKVSGPVGEALIMTAAGLAVAIPAVLGYNILGRLVGRIEADLEGFALDLRDLLLTRAP